MSRSAIVRTLIAVLAVFAAEAPVAAERWVQTDPYGWFFLDLDNIRRDGTWVYFFRVHALQRGIAPYGVRGDFEVALNCADGDMDHRSLITGEWEHDTFVGKSDQEFSYLCAGY